MTVHDTVGWFVALMSQARLLFVRLSNHAFVI